MDGSRLFPAIMEEKYLSVFLSLEAARCGDSITVSLLREYIVDDKPRESYKTE